MRWLQLVAEVDRRESFELGWSSCADWIAWRCGLSPRAAREHVRVARRLAELPLIHDAFARGILSYAKVRALTRVAAAESEAELLELGECLTAAQLDQAVRAYRRVTASEARETHDSEYLEHYFDEDRMLVLAGRLAPEDGALFVRALEAARDAMWTRPGPEESVGSAEPRLRPRRPTNADALVAVAERSLARLDSGSSADERYQVVVHVDVGALAGDDGASVLERAPAVAPETARRLACDASVVRILEENGKPLSVGRKTRVVPASLRRALRVRDGGCGFPGCTNSRFVDAHDLQHWAHGGETSLDNLVLLCRRHHRLVHEHGFSVEWAHDGAVRFRDPWGVPIANAPHGPPATADELVARNARDGLSLDAETAWSGDGERMDLACVVDALVDIAGDRQSGKMEA